MLASHAAGQLVKGQTDRAVSAFEEAAQLVPKDARFQGDLSAAYLGRFKQTRSGGHEQSSCCGDYGD